MEKSPHSAADLVLSIAYALALAEKRLAELETSYGNVSEYAGNRLEPMKRCAESVARRLTT